MCIFSLFSFDMHNLICDGDVYMCIKGFTFKYVSLCSLMAAAYKQQFVIIVLYHWDNEHFDGYYQYRYHS